MCTTSYLLQSRIYKTIMTNAGLENGIGSSHMFLCLGFYPKIYDITLQSLQSGLISTKGLTILPSIDLTKSCKMFSKTDHNSKILVCQNGYFVKRLFKVLTENTETIRTLLCGLDFMKTFNPIRPSCTKYLIKVTKVHTYQEILTAMKDALMMSEIDTIHNILQKDGQIVCKPLFSGLCRNEDTWQYITVMEKPAGEPLNRYLLKHTANKVLSFTFRNSARYHAREKVLCSLRSTLNMLWWLGYSHNNLNTKNIIYDSSNNTMVFINLEMCVAFPLPLVMNFRDTMKQLQCCDDDSVQNKTIDEVAIYRNMLKNPAHSLVCLSSKYIVVQTSKNIITDDLVLQMIADVM